MSYKFGSTSLSRLETCDMKLYRLLNLAISRSPIDFGIAEGHRTLQRQNELFKKGLSKIDGINQIGKHNSNPSKAVDVYAFVNGKASWEVHHLCIIIGVIFSCADELNIKIRSGANWDMDGEFMTDQRFIDLPHIELI